MANFSQKCHLAWWIIVAVSIGNFILACITGPTDSWLFLATEALSLMLTCAVTILLAYQHRRLQLQLAVQPHLPADHLTGLETRQPFIERIATAVAHSWASGEHLSLLWIDIDQFQSLNTRLGIELGDEILRRVAETIRGGIRGWDTAARVGGDEFAVLLPTTSGIDAVAVAERLRMQITAIPFDDIEDTVFLTARIGIACLSTDVTTAEDLMAQAHQCLTEGKRLGGNQVIIDWDTALEAAEG